MKPSQIAIVALAIVCMALGGMLLKLGASNAQLKGELETYKTSTAPPSTVLAPAKTTTKAPKTPADSADVMKVKMQDLQTEIKALNMQLANKDKAIERLQAAVQANEAPPPPTAHPTPVMDWMVRLKTENPERYNRLLAAQGKYTEGIQKQLTLQDAFISELDPGLLDARDQEKLTQLQEGVRHLMELVEQTHESGAPATLSTRRDMYSTMNKLRPLMGVARQAALRDLARQLGYTDKGAVEFSQYVNHVFELTNNIGSPRSLTGR